MSVGRRLSERAVMKENKLRWVSPTAETNTKRDLARVTAKPKSKTQTVTNGCVGRKGNELCCWRSFQHWRPHRVSKIEG